MGHPETDHYLVSLYGSEFAWVGAPEQAPWHMLEGATLVSHNAAYDQAARWRDAGRCVISGFHSPMEEECLRILLRGPQPLIICPARGLERMRIPREWKESLRRGRLLVLSAFGLSDKRATAELAARRNEVVVALADEVWMAHITPGGAMSRLVGSLAAWGVPVCLPG